MHSLPTVDAEPAQIHVDRISPIEIPRSLRAPRYGRSPAEAFLDGHVHIRPGQMWWIDELDSISWTPEPTWTEDRLGMDAYSYYIRPWIANHNPRSNQVEGPHENPSVADPTPIADEPSITEDHLETAPPEEEGLAQSALVALTELPKIVRDRVYGIENNKIDIDWMYEQHTQDITRGALIMAPISMFIGTSMLGHEHMMNYDYIFTRYGYVNWFYHNYEDNRRVIRVAAKLLGMEPVTFASRVYGEYGCEAGSGGWPVPHPIDSRRVTSDEQKRMMTSACQALMRKCLEIIHDHLPPREAPTTVGHSVYML